jgi:3-methyl-2-oxobutanoate hydroxymethyltransferase
MPGLDLHAYEFRLLGRNADIYGRHNAESIISTIQGQFPSASALAFECRCIFRLAQPAAAAQALGMLRPDKKYSVYDLRQLKGKRCLTRVHVKSPEEAAAAEAAGIDLLSCSFDSPSAQARLPLLVAAAPKSFISGATPHGLASPEHAIRIAFKALEIGASSVYCSASPSIIEAMAREGIPVVGHLGMVPRHATWTNFRAIGKTPAEARQLYDQMKRLENAGAYAAELELVPHRLASFLCKNTSMILMSLGSGSGCDTQFLFSDDILGDYDERIPRHAKAYRNFLKEHQRLQNERIAAFKEYADDVKAGRFPEAGHLIDVSDEAFEEAIEAIENRMAAE